MADFCSERQAPQCTVQPTHDTLCSARPDHALSNVGVVLDVKLCAAVLLVAALPCCCLMPSLCVLPSLLVGCLYIHSGVSASGGGLLTVVLTPG
jgi:hypothetical protein